MSFIGQYADTETPDLKGASSSLQITWLRRKTIPMVESGALQRQRKIFGEFVVIEMLSHAKAFELYTLAYQSIQSMDEEADLESMC
ncbi:CBY1-interacting BAR domain-containing protein 1 isoform X5 [Boleophthalmus pectinirostris]|uniref:CBY1-interacting BAR domain-containing protein 1 isoform X5 n=1 Tax=Boleophthalmus pectinirostris TaxID=150288 RepID=UPI00242AF95F|nr:CBY1-interacting BAR domain-containing protein 1 isoform X5 [Boleophthalmus pectinirostris]XP_055013393.1 CBY1-interacting BAR domain-containing protein 1 isoform X5 [Boleophthalmus pectinirostris]